MNRACKKCGEEKPLEEFYKGSKYRDGMMTTCKVCYRKYQRQYRDKPEIKAQNAAYHKEWLKRNPGYHVQRYAEDAEKQREYSRSWKAANKEKVKAARRKHYIKNRDAIIQKQKEYNNNYKPKCRAKINASRKRSVANLCDFYVRGIISRDTGVSADQIPIEVVEHKRLQIQLKRKLKAIKNGTSKVSTQH